MPEFWNGVEQGQGGGGSSSPTSGQTRDQVLALIRGNATEFTVGTRFPGSPLSGALHYMTQDTDPDNPISAKYSNGRDLTLAEQGNLFRYNGTNWVLVYNFRSLIELLIGLSSLYAGDYATNTAYAKNRIVTHNDDIFWTVAAVADTNTTAPASNASFVQLNGGGGSSSGITAQQFLAAMPDELKIRRFGINEVFININDIKATYNGHVLLFPNAFPDATKAQLLLSGYAGTEVAYDPSSDIAVDLPIPLNATERNALQTSLRDITDTSLEIRFLNALGQTEFNDTISVPVVNIPASAATVPSWVANDEQVPVSQLRKDLRIVDFEISPPFFDPDNLEDTYSAHVTKADSSFPDNTHARLRLQGQGITGTSVPFNGNDASPVLNLNATQKAALKTHLASNSRLDLTLDFGTIISSTFVVDTDGTFDFFIPRASVGSDDGTGGGTTDSEKEKIDALENKTVDLRVTTTETWALATGGAGFVGLSSGVTALSQLQAGQVPTGVSGWSADTTTLADRVIVVRLPRTANPADYRLLEATGRIPLDAWTVYATGSTYQYIGSPGLRLSSAGRIRLQHHGTDPHTDYTGGVGDATVDASGFSGNLSTTDDTVQEALDTIDGLNLGGSSEMEEEENKFEWVNVPVSRNAYMGFRTPGYDFGGGIERDPEDQYPQNEQDGAALGWGYSYYAASGKNFYINPTGGSGDFRIALFDLGGIRGSGRSDEIDGTTFLVTNGSPANGRNVAFQASGLADVIPSTATIPPQSAAIVSFTSVGTGNAQRYRMLVSPLGAGVVEDDKEVLTGTAVPAGSLGVVGDVYIRTNTSGSGMGQVYKKTGTSTWTLQIDFATQEELNAVAGKIPVFVADIQPNYYVKTGNARNYNIRLDEIDASRLSGVNQITVWFQGLNIHVEAFDPTDDVSQAIAAALTASEAGDVTTNLSAATTIEIELRFRTAADPAVYAAGDTQVYHRKYELPALATDPNAPPTPEAQNTPRRVATLPTSDYELGDLVELTAVDGSNQPGLYKVFKVANGYEPAEVMRKPLVLLAWDETRAYADVTLPANYGDYRYFRLVTQTIGSEPNEYTDVQYPVVALQDARRDLSGNARALGSANNEKISFNRTTRVVSKIATDVRFVYMELV